MGNAATSKLKAGDSCRLVDHARVRKALSHSSASQRVTLHLGDKIRRLSKKNNDRSAGITRVMGRRKKKRDGVPEAARRNPGAGKQQRGVLQDRRRCVMLSKVSTQGQDKKRLPWRAGAHASPRNGIGARDLDCCQDEESTAP